MVGQLKEDVGYLMQRPTPSCLMKQSTMVGQLVQDYQGLPAHLRIEAMCTLLDLSMPFEIRFLGSLIEHLGRKDFGSLREAESRANSFANGNPEDKKRLLQSLGEVAPLCLVNGTQYGNPLMHPNSFNDSPANRPSPTHVSDTKGRQQPQDSFHGPDNQNDHGESLNSHDISGPKGNAKGVSSVSNHIGFSSEEETESMCIINDLKRRKLILYISVLSPTNHDGANLYYTILSDIDDNPALTWLEDLDKDAQEEVSLLYTLATRHPAFTFEQRMFLGTVANRVNDIVSSKFPSRANANLQQQPHQSHNSNPGTHPIYYNHTAIPHLDPKYGGYYIIAHPAMHIQQPPHQPSSVPSNGEQLRNPPVAAPFQYASFSPYFVPHHAATISHPTPLNSPYAQNLIASSMPIVSTASIVSATGQNLLQGTPVTPCSNSNTVVQGNNLVGANTSHQLSSPSSKIQHSQTQLPNTSTTASNSMSQQSCVSTPSRTSSVPFHSEQNSVDGDSAEESSENCDWNSPESSPFESPPQSLTPSRSQSPPSGVPNSTSVQTVSLSGHGSTFVVASSGNSIPYGGSVNNVGSNSSSPSSTIVKTEFHPNSGLVITTATSCSTTSSLTSASNIGGSGNGPTTNSNSSPSGNTGNIMNPNKTSNMTASIHHTQLPPQCHLPPQSTPSARGPTKNTSSVPNNSNNQSFSNHPPNAVVVSTSSVIAMSQQPQALPQSMMGPTVPVHLQQTSTLTSANSVGGIVSHSMSSANPPLSVAFAQQSHGAHNNLGLNTGGHPPPSQNNFPCYPHMNSAVSFGGMNAAAAYRATAQGVLTRNQYIQSHPVVAAASALLNNQMGMKGPDLQRGGHNVHGSLRQKPQRQNTPKRRTNVNSGGLVNMPVGGSSPHANNSQSTSGKGDEVCDSTKDNRNSEIVVSANPSNNKGSLQQQERTSGGGGKPYHHNVSNGLVNAHPASSAGAVLPGNPLSNIIPSNNSTGIPNSCPQPSVASNAGGPIIPTVPSKEDGLLGDGIAGIEGYAINQIPYHVNGPQVYGHPGGQFMLPNGYMTSSHYNPAMGAAAAVMGSGGPPAPPSTEIMMNPACVPHFSFPFTIPHSFSNLPSTASSKGISNAKDKANSLHGNSNNASGAADSSSKSMPSNQHENHVTPASHSSGYYRTASQPNRNNRGVILDIGGGALGNSSLSPVNVDVAAMPPLDDLVETIHRPRKISCYNCGLDTHLGPDCKDGSMEEMTRHQFRVNYSGPSSVTADGKDGD